MSNSKLKILNNLDLFAHAYYSMMDLDNLPILKQYFYGKRNFVRTWYGWTYPCDNYRTWMEIGLHSNLIYKN